jgi:hypothetical protein
MTHTPIRDAEQLRWQRDAVAVLGKLLELAARRGLPVIAWRLAPAGAQLAGECHCYPVAARRAEFAAWRDALGEPDKEYEHTSSSGGAVRLTAVWDRGGSAGKGLRPLLSDRDGYQRASVVLVADIYAADDDDQEAGQ